MFTVILKARAERRVAKDPAEANRKYRYSLFATSYSRAQ